MRTYTLQDYCKSWKIDDPGDLEKPEHHCCRPDCFEIVKDGKKLILKPDDSLCDRWGVKKSKEFQVTPLPSPDNVHCLAVYIKLKNKAHDEENGKHHDHGKKKHVVHQLSLIRVGDKLDVDWMAAEKDSDKKTPQECPDAVVAQGKRKRFHGGRAHAVEV